MTRFERIVRTMLEVHKAKNHDYSREGQFGNFSESERINVEPWRGAFVRLQDKYTRACNLIARDGQAMVLDEKLEDTLLDLANYSVIVLCLLEEARSCERKAKKEAEAEARARQEHYQRWLGEPSKSPPEQCSVQEQIAAIHAAQGRHPASHPRLLLPGEDDVGHFPRPDA